MKPYSESEEVELDDTIRIFPPSNARKWLVKLKEFSEFACAAYNEMKADRDTLAVKLADSQTQVANLRKHVESQNLAA